MRHEVTGGENKADCSDEDEGSGTTERVRGNWYVDLWI